MRGFKGPSTLSHLKLLETSFGELPRPSSLFQRLCCILGRRGWAKCALTYPRIQTNNFALRLKASSVLHSGRCSSFKSTWLLAFVCDKCAREQNSGASRRHFTIAIANSDLGELFAGIKCFASDRGPDRIAAISGGMSGCAA